MENISNSYQSTNTKSIFTRVRVGKSYKSKGWALTRSDIGDLIPVSQYEGECTIKIGNIYSPAKLRINPRLFYHGNELSNYLKELYDINPDIKVPMEIKMSDERIYKNFISKYPHNIELDTLTVDLLVGKSYKSKGWRIKKEITSTFIPLEEYEDYFDIVVDGYESKANIDIQARLFYSGTEMIGYLKELYEKNPNQEVSVTLIFDKDLSLYDIREVNLEEKNKETHQNSDKTIKNEFNRNNIIDSHDEEISFSYEDNFCVICGSKLKSEKINKELISLHEAYPILCISCLEKIFSITSFYKLKEIDSSNYVMKEVILEKWPDDDFDYAWNLLMKYGMLENIGQLFRANIDSDMEERYENFIDIGQEEVIEEQNPKDICSICGNKLDSENDTICSECINKHLAINYLKEINRVLNKSNFFISDLSEEFGDLKANLIISQLLKYDLIIEVTENFFHLNSEIINLFLTKYGEKNQNIF